MTRLQKLFIISCLGTLSACSALSKYEVHHAWCAPQDEQINLSADALFKFDQSSSKDLLPEGKASLDELADKLNTYVHVDKIHLTGHTDRLGSEQYNNQLGLQRAETVRNYLIAHGVKVPITVSSAGETQPVTTNCMGEKATKTLTACLQPDRRVTVDIIGIHKK